MNKITILTERLKKINISIDLWTNYPWIYLYKINGVTVTEKHASEYGYTIAFHPIKSNQELELTNIKDLFKLIRSYLTTDEEIYDAYMNGWFDNLYSIDKVTPKCRILKQAYITGWVNSEVGDDISSIDYQTKEEIINNIKNEVNGFKRTS